LKEKCFKNSGLFSWALAKTNGWHQKMKTFSQKIDRLCGD